MMAGAYDILLKYAVNLMKTNRPRSWRSIKTTTRFFQTRVACMKGALDVLKAMGYTIETGSSIEFPPEVVLPDPERLSKVAAEILMAKLEVEKMKREAESERRYPPPGADQNSYEDQQTQDLGSTGSHSPQSSSHLSKCCWGESNFKYSQLCRCVRVCVCVCVCMAHVCMSMLHVTTVAHKGVG